MNIVNKRDTKIYDIYGGRSGGHLPYQVPVGSEGWLGNPHDVTGPKQPTCRECGKTHTHEEAIAAFERYFRERINSDQEFLEAVLRLKDYTIACWCHPLKCHLDVIAAWFDAGCPLMK